MLDNQDDAYLEAGGTVKKTKRMATHDSRCMTMHYDRTGDEITFNDPERIAA